MYTKCSIKEASCYFFSGSFICNWVSGKEFRAKFSCVELKLTSIIQNNLYLYGAPRKKSFKNKWIFVMEFEKWQIKI